MSDRVIDILMITYNRAGYTQRSLPRLLDTCDQAMRVWVWHNGADAATLDAVKSCQSHPRFYRLHHSPENKRLREPTNWFFAESDGAYLCKIDDDNLMPDGWGATLRAAHEAEPKLGVIGCWSFRPEDLMQRAAERKVRRFGDQRIMVNPWVAGTGYVMKRGCYAQSGPIQDGQSFPNYCTKLALSGWINGWYYPFVYMENMDDPRSAYTQLRTEEDFQKNRGLSAKQFGVKSLSELRRRQTILAHELQTASPNPRHHVGWRGRLSLWARRIRYWKAMRAAS